MIKEENLNLYELDGILIDINKIVDSLFSDVLQNMKKTDNKKEEILLDTNINNKLENEVKLEYINNKTNGLKLSYLIKLKHLKDFINFSNNGKLNINNENYYLDDYLLKNLKKLLNKYSNSKIYQINKEELLNVFKDYIKEEVKTLLNMFKDEKNLKYFKKYFNIEEKTLNEKELLEKIGFLKKTDGDIKIGNHLSLANLFFFKTKGSILQLRNYKFKDYNEFKEFFDNLTIDRLSNIENIFKYNKEKLKIEEQEFIQSVVISEVINFNNKNIDLKNIKDIIKRNIKYVKYKNFDELTVKKNIEKISKLFEKNIEWIESGIKQGELLKIYLKNNNKYYIYEQSYFLNKELIKHILWLIKKEKKEFENKIDINKWNPSDIFILNKDNIKEFQEKILKFNDINQLNNYIRKELISKKLIGVSLKKIKDNKPFYMIKNNLEENEKEYLNKIDLFRINNINLNIFNDNLNKKKFEKLINNKYIRFVSINELTEGTSFEMRTFNNGKAFSGEINKKGSNARHGKIGEGPIFHLTRLFINYYFKDNKDINNKLLNETNKLEEIFSNIKKENDIKLSDIINMYYLIFNKSVDLGLLIDNKNINKKITYKELLKLLGIVNKNIIDKLNEKELKDYINNNLEKELKKEFLKNNKSYNDWKISKYKSMALTNLFLEISKEKQDLRLFNILLTWLYLYASSQLDISSPYLKSFEKEELLRELVYYAGIHNIKIDISDIKNKNKLIKNIINKLIKNKKITKEDKIVLKDIYSIYEKELKLNLMN